MFKHLTLFALFVVLTGIGLVGGWFAARQSMPAPAPEDDAAASEEGPAGFNERTLANMGVRVEPVQPRPFTRFRAIQAVIQDRPENVRPVVAPLGGILTEVHVEAGGVVAAGAPIATFVRDPIPRPRPDLTADLLTPISEDVHGAVSKLRSALGRIRIVDRNLARIRQHTAGAGGVPVLRGSEIEFENERARLEVELEDARHELERHGLEPDEVKAIENGRSAPPNVHLWEHALRRGGLWPPAADAIRAALPAGDRGLPWSIVAIGELSAAGLATPQLAQALVDVPALAAHFAEAAGLLDQGMPLPTVRLLAESGALAPEVVVRAPASVARWDVTSVPVRAGARVAAGATLAELHDARTMWLRLEPVGREVALVVRALEQGAAMEATPLIPDAGPTLEGVRLRRIDTRSDEGHHAGHAYADVRNEVLGPDETSDAPSRSWTLRTGTRYLAKVPVEVLPNCYVLPASAVTTSGVNRIVYLRDGDSFKAQVVRVLYEDDAIVVLPAGDGIFPGDPVAVSGAFALRLALEQAAGGGDDHAGHGHAHN